MFKLVCDNCNLISQGWDWSELGIDPYETSAAEWDMNLVDPTDNQFGICAFCATAGTCYEAQPTPF